MRSTGTPPPNLCASLESLEMALAILSLDHRMDPRLRGLVPDWCGSRNNARWFSLLNDRHHLSIIYRCLTFPTVCVCAWEKECVCVCVSHSYVTLNLSPSNQQLSTRQALTLIVEIAWRVYLASPRAWERTQFKIECLVFEKCVGCLWSAHGSGVK